MSKSKTESFLAYIDKLTKTIPYFEQYLMLYYHFQLCTLHKIHKHEHHMWYFRVYEIKIIIVTTYTYFKTFMTYL